MFLYVKCFFNSFNFIVVIKYLRTHFYILLLIVVSDINAQSTSNNITIHDSLNKKHWGYETDFQIGRVLKLDKYQKAYMKESQDYSLTFKLNHISLPSDSDSYAYDYHYPTFSIVGKFSKNNSASMHREYNFPHWNYLTDDYFEIAPYNTHLGNSFALFGSFSYPILRNRKWELNLSGNLGLAYSSKKYDKKSSVDNDMIGSHLLFYAGGGVSATYRILHSWGIKAGLDYWHISNGSTKQPNRSVNVFGPTLGLVYYPYYHHLLTTQNKFIPNQFHPYWYINIKGGIGIKTCFEDWERTQYCLNKSHPDWRTEDFTIYSVASIQTDLMYRYARIGSIGFGFDIQYSSCYSHIKEIDESRSPPVYCKHSPWSVALDAKHTLFYGNVSFILGAGIYLLRNMGDYSNRKEPIFFNRIGVHYTIPKLYNITLGIEVKAHLTNADFTEFVMSYPLNFKQIK